MKKTVILVIALVFACVLISCNLSNQDNKNKDKSSVELSSSQQSKADIVFNNKSMWEKHPQRNLKCYSISMFTENGTAYLQCSYGTSPMQDNVSIDDLVDSTASQIAVTYKIEDGMPETTVRRYGLVTMIDYNTKWTDDKKKEAIQKAVLSL